MPKVARAYDQTGRPFSTDSSTQRGRLRVLHVQIGRQYGGIQRMLVCLAECRDQCPSMEPSFALCSGERLAEELTPCGVDVYHLGSARLRSPWKTWQAQRRLRALLAGKRFDVVICHGTPALALLGPAVQGSYLPYVFWMHNDLKSRNKNVIEFLAGRQRPDLVIANSEFTAASLPFQFTRIPPHVVIPCPVTRPTGPPFTENEREAIRAELGTPQDAVVIALVGRPEAWKGHALLLQALARLRGVPNWACWIIGGPFDAAQTAFLDRLREAAREGGIADRVHFLGQRHDVPKLLAAADLFCQPNLTPEPFGIVFVEALYAGLPVVSAEHGGAKEIVDASCGRLVKPNDVAELTSALDDLICDAPARAVLSRNAPMRGAAISDPRLVLATLEKHLVHLVQPVEPITIPSSCEKA